ncbi:hypothetical protein LVB77_03445 [Lysobacter sp. 5GHs7-4]|uniref:hypothetical protein n=1 Tax=Lysobacter sp. 5GHs7-4 TaxID=2904253 RepID=UPI001E62527E|nr:hypothetical protein [Lysobacter sp. 5GHs7-4]UHQ23779.1 hypothetical protein LVB77_03445 [Lysobacter sp. 5GHs7-4]
MKLASAIVCVSLCAAAGQARAQAVPLGSNPIIGGVTVSCPGTLTYIVPMDDLAKAVPGEIHLNPQFFSQPAEVQIFVYAHECAHQFYGGGPIGEANADCWAMKRGRDQGWMPPHTTALIAESVIYTAGDWSHAPGPQRVEHMAVCYNTP